MAMAGAACGSEPVGYGTTLAGGETQESFLRQYWRMFYKRRLVIIAMWPPLGVITVGHPAPDRKSGSLKRGWVPRQQFVRWEGW